MQLARLVKLLAAPIQQATFDQLAPLTAKKVREDADLNLKGANSYIVVGDGAEDRLV